MCAMLYVRSETCSLLLAFERIRSSRVLLECSINPNLWVLQSPCCLAHRTRVGRTSWEYEENRIQDLGLGWCACWLLPLSSGKLMHSTPSTRRVVYI